MALPNPRILPAAYFGQVTYELARNDLGSPDTTGSPDGVQMGFPLWYAEYELRSVSDRTARTPRAWINSLLGQSVSFIALDLTRLFPANYPNGFAGMNRAGGGAFAGSALSYSLDGTRTVVSLTGLPSGFVIVEGDLLGFKWSGGDKRHVVEVIEGATATTGGGGGSMTITVNPAVFSVVPAHPTGVAHFDNPACLMKQLPHDDMGASSVDGEWVRGIRARQVLAA